MPNCTFLSVGNIKEDYLTDALTEYKKRISAYAKIDEIELKEEKLADESPARVAAALEAEADKILARIPDDAFVIALCVEGKAYSSEEFAALIGQAADRTGKIFFVIGSSYGLSPRVKARADARISFSRMTFPHQLMRVILSEQVYRAFTILAGKKYHK